MRKDAERRRVDRAVFMTQGWGGWLLSRQRDIAPSEQPLSAGDAHTNNFYDRTISIFLSQCRRIVLSGSDDSHMYSSYKRM